jgi:hypothetical protein
MNQPHPPRPFRGLLAAAVLAAAAFSPHGARAQEIVPVRVRVAKASRAPQAQIDPRFEDAKRQISQLAWQKWELVSDRTLALPLKGAATFVELPDGSHAALSVTDVHGGTVTVEVSIAQKNTQTRVTVERGQRIVHQVAKEKKGVALFLVITPWP